MRRRLKLVVAVVGLVGLGATAGFASSSFTDVPAGRYYTDAVEWAFENGVTTGTSATTFSPEDPVTRGQNVTFAYRYDQNVVQPALDALVTLDELSCTATQVVINDNGWRCANPVLKPSFQAAGANRALVTEGRVGQFTSVAIGADGNPVISHHDSTNDDLELYVCDNPTCTSGTNQTLETAGSVGYDPSVAIGVDGDPVIGHYDNTNADLELYVCDNPTCTTGTNRTLETAGFVGRRTSLAIGAAGNPILSHQDDTGDDLELYVCDNPSCGTGTNFTLATTGRSGYDTSVAIGVDGIPVISHQNIDEGDLELSFGPTTTYTVTFE